MKFPVSAILGLAIVSCGKAPNSTISSQTTTQSLIQKLKGVSCVSSVESEKMVPNGLSTGNLLITINANTPSSVCMTSMLNVAPGLQILNTLETVGYPSLIVSKDKETTASIPNDLKDQLAKVSCFSSVEPEKWVDLFHPNQPVKFTGNFIAVVSDTLDSASCAHQLYSKIPGARIQSQTDKIFIIRGK